MTAIDEQFWHEVGVALASRDTHWNPEVARVAAIVRAKLYEPMVEAAVRDGQLIRVAPATKAKH